MQVETDTVEATDYEIEVKQRRLQLFPQKVVGAKDEEPLY